MTGEQIGGGRFELTQTSGTQCVMELITLRWSSSLQEMSPCLGNLLQDKANKIISQMCFPLYLSLPKNNLGKKKAITLRSQRDLVCGCCDASWVRMFVRVTRRLVVQIPGPAE